MVSGEFGVMAATPSGWQDAFFSGGEASLATRQTDDETLGSNRLKATLGEVIIERELPHERIAAMEADGPLARKKLRPCALQSFPLPVAPYGRARCDLLGNMGQHHRTDARPVSSMPPA